jgi:oligosaccharide repeat unit polymerase
VTPKRLIFIVVFLFLSLTILLVDNLSFLGNLYFYLIISYIGFSVISNRNFQLIDVWNGGFVFIILSEIIINRNPDMYMLSASKYLMIANNIVNIGFLSKNNHLIQRSNGVIMKRRNNRYIMIILLSFVLFYIIVKFPGAVTSFSYGRNNSFNEGGSLIGYITNSIGYVLPAILAYYFSHIKQKKIWIPLILSLPIFIILFMGGSRFPLLFSLLGFAIVAQEKYSTRLTIKNYIIISVIGIGLLYSSKLMKTFRSTGAAESGFTIQSNKNKNDNLAVYISREFMSPEGVVDMTALMFKHFEKNEHLYGASSSFILYFWIPRSFWPEKPTMLGYWFIRQYRDGFGDGHSASFGFTGDLYADFGLFSLIIVFFLGRLLKITDNYRRRAFNSGGYNTILGAMFYPFVFFFVQ